MAIGTKLDELLKLRGSNPNKLSKATNVSAATIYSIIRRNNTKVDLEDLQAICDELGVGLDYFVEKKNSNPDTITPWEKKLIERYRSLDARGRAAVDNIMAFELSQLSPHVFSARTVAFGGKTHETTITGEEKRNLANLLAEDE